LVRGTFNAILTHDINLLRSPVAKRAFFCEGQPL
jgi:hypothetical protein